MYYVVFLDFKMAHVVARIIIYIVSELIYNTH